VRYQQRPILVIGHVPQPLLEASCTIVILQGSTPIYFAINALHLSSPVPPGFQSTKVLIRSVNTLTRKLQSHSPICESFSQRASSLDSSSVGTLQLANYLVAAIWCCIPHRNRCQHHCIPLSHHLRYCQFIQQSRIFHSVFRSALTILRKTKKALAALTLQNFQTVKDI
jgi:hypothetical protein